MVKLPELTVALATILADANRGASGRREIADRLRDVADQLVPKDLALTPGAASTVAGPPAPSRAHREAWGRIWAYWVRATGKVRAKETPERKRAVLARLRDGYAEADIMRAIDGCLASEHHVEGDYTDLTLICRNGAKLEAFVAKAGATPALGTEATPNPTREAIEALEVESMEALEAGDGTRYRELQDRIGRLRDGGR